MSRKPKDMSPSAKLGFGEHFGYLLGGNININASLFGTFLIVYYTMIVGVSPGLAGTVIAVSKVLDGISDLLMGYVVDHTKSKMGKARPWLLRMIGPMVACALLAFFVPASWGTTGKIVYMFVTYNLANTVCYTALSVPYHALNGLTTTNQASRSINGGLYMLGTNALCVILVQGFFLRLSGIFGGGDIYTQQGFTKTVLFYMVIFAVSTALCALLTKERVVETQVLREDETAKAVPTRLILKSLVTNRYWILVVIASTLASFMAGAAGSTTVYYAQFVAQKIELQSSMASLYSLIMIPALIVGTALLPKFGKRNIMIFGMALAIVNYFVPLISNDTLPLLICTAGKGIGIGIGSAGLGSLVQDAITYGRWKNGFSAIGMGNAAQTFSQKIGTGLGTAVLGWILDAGKFSGELAVQPASAITAINILFIVVPAVACVGILVCMFFYDLDKKYASIEADLLAGRFAPDAKLPE